jgi:hypothetical protein
MKTDFVIKTQKKTGAECLNIQGDSIGVTLADYWSWAHSDIVSNTERGKLAEFIVASALGLSSGVSDSWAKCDLLYRKKNIEVKSSAYLQSWYQKCESAIYFGAHATHGWRAETNTLDTEKKRQADIYVLCLLAHRDKHTVNPLNLEQWQFYAVTTNMLDRLIPTLNSISLKFLDKNNIESFGYADIRSRVDELINRESAVK